MQNPYIFRIRVKNDCTSAVFLRKRSLSDSFMEARLLCLFRSQTRLLKRNVNPVIVIESLRIPDTRVKLKRFGVELGLIDGERVDGLPFGADGNPRGKRHRDMAVAIGAGGIVIVSRDVAGGATSGKIHARSEGKAIGDRPIAGDAANPAVRPIGVAAEAACEDALHHVSALVMPGDATEVNGVIVGGTGIGGIVADVGVEGSGVHAVVDSPFPFAGGVIAH